MSSSSSPYVRHKAVWEDETSTENARLKHLLKRLRDESRRVIKDLSAEVRAAEASLAVAVRDADELRHRIAELETQLWTAKASNEHLDRDFQPSRNDDVSGTPPRTPSHTPNERPAYAADTKQSLRRQSKSIVFCRRPPLAFTHSSSKLDVSNKRSAEDEEYAGERVRSSWLLRPDSIPNLSVTGCDANFFASLRCNVRDPEPPRSPPSDDTGSSQEGLL